MVSAGADFLNRNENKNVQTALIITGVLFLVFITGLLAAKRWRGIGGGHTRIVLSGGGTGGHVNPALAIAEAIRGRDPEARFLYIGVRNRAESIIVKRAGYSLRFVASEGFPGFRISFRLLRFLFVVSIGVAQSIIMLCLFAPKRVIATGGYVSAPVIAAALILKKLRIASVQIFLHEQNSIPGQLNALMGRWVDKVLLTFPQTLSFFPKNGAVVGYPIRHSIVPIPPEKARENLQFKIPPDRSVVFAFGGSQGARSINRAVVDALPFLLQHRDRLFLIHGIGLASMSEYDAEADTEARIEKTLSAEEKQLLDGFYYRQDYFHNIAEVYSVCTLVACRSGAGSLNEISRIGKPALLIPKANLPGDHQVMNARAMKSAGAAELLYEDTIMEEGQILEKLDGRVLAEKIILLLDNAERLKSMSESSRHFLKRRASERILNELYGETRFSDSDNNSTPFKELTSNSGLLQTLSAAYNSMGRQFDPLSVVGDPDDLDYYRHRAAGLLSHKGWEDRNLGVKLIGLTRYTEKIPTLLKMLADRTPVNRASKLFGGDYQQVGFIRRNIVQALRVLDYFDPEVERGLFAALSDGYFEVRAQACITAAHFGRFIESDSKWLDALMNRMADPCFEVVIEAAKAVGEVGVDEEAAGALLAIKEAHYWQVRNAALHGLKRMIDRGALEASPALLAEVSAFILTSTDFKPHFTIKETFTVLQDRCAASRSKNYDLRLPAGKAAGKLK